MTKNRLHCLFAVLFVTAVLAGCAPSKILPERFAEVNEAYPDAASTVSPSDRPAAVERATFSAPLAVVYRVALTTAAQVGLRIVSDDKEQGVILAEEIIDNLPAPRRTCPQRVLPGCYR